MLDAPPCRTAKPGFEEAGRELPGAIVLDRVVSLEVSDRRLRVMCLDTGEAFVLLAVIYGLPIVLITLFFVLLLVRSLRRMNRTNGDSLGSHLMNDFREGIQ